MDKLKLAYDYITACQTQSAYEHMISQGFQLINPDNTVFGLADIIHKPYLELVLEILGEEVFDWMQYWQYECDYGKASMDFSINDVEYNTQDMTLYKFLEVTCGLTKQDTN